MGSSGIQTIGTRVDDVITSSQYTSNTGSVPALGSITVNNGNWYKFFKATGTIAAYSLVAIDENYEASVGAGYSATVPREFGITQAAMVSGDYGWALQKGNGTVLAKNACALDVKIYTSGTAGVVDDDSSSQNLIPGLRLNATNSSGGDAAMSCTASTFMYSAA